MNQTDKQSTSAMLDQSGKPGQADELNQSGKPGQADELSQSGRHFGDILKDARMAQQLTAFELSEALGISMSYEHDLERNRSTPSLDLFCKIIRYLDLSADDYVYPEQTADDSDRARLRRLIGRFDDRQIAILLESANQLTE